MGSLVSRLLGVKGCLIVGATCLAAGAASGGGVAWRIQDANIAELKLTAAQAEADAFARGWAEERAAEDISNTSETGAVKAKAEIHWRTRTLIEKVPTYVSAKSDAACVVNVGAVRLFNAAARGAVPAVPVTAPGAHVAPRPAADPPRAGG